MYIIAFALTRNERLSWPCESFREGCLEIVCCGEEPLDQAVTRISTERRSQGYHPYTILLGGSNALGSLGYFLAFFEVIKQTQELGWFPQTFVCSVGSAGTLAGLVAAMKHLIQHEKLPGAIMFWHTGGGPVVFDKHYSEELLRYT